MVSGIFLRQKGQRTKLLNGNLVNRAWLGPVGDAESHPGVGIGAPWPEEASDIFFCRPANAVRNSANVVADTIPGPLEPVGCTDAPRQNIVSYWSLLKDTMLDQLHQGFLVFARKKAASIEG